MAQLESLLCPLCGASLIPPDFSPDGRGRAPTASDFQTCLRKCESCGIGFSNASSRPTLIYRDPQHNVPPQVRNGLLASLENSLNQVNRVQKYQKFGFSTSEDAVTWTAFTAVMLADALANITRKLFAADVSTGHSLALWGVPQPHGKPDRHYLRQRLEAVVANLGELPRSLSEPDVVIANSSEVIIMEAKYRSPNDDVATDDSRWHRYLSNTSAFKDEVAVRESRRYELARNWRIGWDLAQGGQFALVNLGPKTLFEQDRAALDKLEGGLHVTARTRFIRWTWNDVLACHPDMPGWLSAYCRSHSLV